MLFQPGKDKAVRRSYHGLLVFKGSLFELATGSPAIPWFLCFLQCDSLSTSGSEKKVIRSSREPRKYRSLLKCSGGITLHCYSLLQGTFFFLSTDNQDSSYEMPAFPLFSLGHLQAWPRRKYLPLFNSVPITKQLALSGSFKGLTLYFLSFFKPRICYVLCLVAIYNPQLRC